MKWWRLLAQNNDEEGKGNKIKDVEFRKVNEQENKCIQLESGKCSPWKSTTSTTLPLLYTTPNKLKIEPFTLILYKMYKILYIMITKLSTST